MEKGEQKEKPLNVEDESVKTKKQGVSELSNAGYTTSLDMKLIWITLIEVMG